MIDPEINEEFFPFDCSNDNCKKRFGMADQHRACHINNLM
jgi:hypothetical protein